MKNASIETKKISIIENALLSLDDTDLINIHNDHNPVGDEDHIYSMNEFDRELAQYSAYDVAAMVSNGYFDGGDDYFHINDFYNNIVTFSEARDCNCPICTEDLAWFVFAHDCDYDIPALREALDEANAIEECDSDEE